MITLKGVGMLPTRKLVGVNRTGAALTIGGVYALDTTWTDATNSTDADSALTNIVSVATANLRGFNVIAENAAEAAAQCTVLVTGRISALVDGTTDVAVGDPLIAQNGSINLVKQGTSTTPASGIALEARTTNAGTLTDIFYDGWELWRQQAGGATAVLTTVAASTIVENIAAETQFDTTVVVPANTLKAGDVVHIHGYTANVAATNSTNTLTVTLRFGPGAATLVASGTLIATGPALDAGANSVCVFDFYLTVQTVGATTGTCKGSGLFSFGVPGSAAGITSAVSIPTTHTTSVTIDTTIAEYFGAALITSGQHADNESYLEQLIVEVIHA
jgi:hypothetical protein